jgi:hypothetical protein
MNNNPYSAPKAPIDDGSAPVKRRGYRGISASSKVGIGGWLVVLCITLFIGLAMRGYALFVNIGIFSGPVYGRLTSPNSMQYDPNWGWALWTETILLIALIGLNILALSLLFMKKKTFTLWFIIFASLGVVSSIVVAVLCHSIDRFPRDQLGSVNMAIFQTIIYASIWVTYVLRSVRVKNTMVN